MRRGTRVGEAYVAITADGTNLNEEIVESVDAAGTEIERKGEDHGEGYGEGFGDSLEDTLEPIMDRLGKALGQRLSKQIGNSLRGSFSSSSQNSIVGRLGEALSDRVEDSMAEVEDRIAAAVKKASSGGGSGSGGGTPTVSGNAGVSGSNPASMDQTLYKTSLAFATMFEKARLALHENANKAIADNDKALAKAQQSMLDDLMKGEQDKTAFLGRFEAARVKMREASTEAITKAEDALTKKMFKDNDALVKSQKTMMEALLKGEASKTDFLGRFEAARTKLRETSNETILKDDAALVKAQRALMDQLIAKDKSMWLVRTTTAKAYTKFLADRERGTVDEQGNSQRSDSSFSNSVGSMFGKGSRNNFLNLIGSGVANVVKLQQGVSGLISTVTGFGGAGASAFSKFTVSAASSGVALAIVAVAMSALVTVASALLAIMTALVSTIASGLVGAALVGAAGLGAVAVAAGLLTVAFTSMTTAQSDAMKATFQPLKAELTGIGQLMITQMIPYFSTWAGNLQRALYQITPLARVMGDAFGRAGNILTASLSGPGFQKLTAGLATYLPDIVTKLSRALGSFLNGAAGLFAILLPYVNRFSGYLRDVAQRFSDFVNSDSGRNSVVDFVDRALDSLQSLWNFTREAMGAIFDIIFSDEAQNFGNSMFDSLTESLQTFREYVADGGLEEWFANAAAFGSQLWSVVTALGDTFIALYNSGVLEAVGTVLGALASTIDVVNSAVTRSVDAIGFILPNVMAAAVAPVLAVVSALALLGQALSFITGNGFDVEAIMGPLRQIPQNFNNPLGNGGLSLGTRYIGPGLDAATGRSDPSESRTAATSRMNMPNIPTLSQLQASGNTALNETYESDGGYVPDPTDPTKKKPNYKNPYKKMAQEMIRQAPTASQTVKSAMQTVNDRIRSSLSDVGQATSGSAVTDALQNTIDSVREDARLGVDSARSAVAAAGEQLLNASSKKEAKKALKNANNAKAALAAAKAERDRMKAAADILDAQKVLSGSNVAALLSGYITQNATLADFAEARAQIVGMIENANQKLADAVALRDDYKNAVADGVRTFGSILSAQAQTIDGVQQSLTATNITTTMRERLAEITKFQADLRILLSRGLSNEAYKQLVDAGVETGGAYVDALVKGGAGTVAEVNGLVTQINAAAEGLGVEASNRLYQAGVDAAQGLVDGLNSLSAQLDSAAAQLGNSIADAVKRALGIASPSKVMLGITRNVGSTLISGLSEEEAAVERAANRLGSRITVAPSTEVARYTAEQSRNPQPVSGNAPVPAFRDLIVNTPTEDPKAVANEVLNEVTGALP